MLVVTTNALEAGTKTLPFPSWPGLHVLVVLPGADFAREEFEELNDKLVVVEWLQHPENGTALLCDVIRWLENRLSEDEGPLLYMDQLPKNESGFHVPGRITPFTVDTIFRPGGQISQLVLGDIIATSPLLPRFFRNLRGSAINDAQLAELLNDLFNWEDK